MDTAILATLVVGFTGTILATVGFFLQLNSRLDSKFDRIDARFDRLFELLEKHILDKDRHVA